MSYKFKGSKAHEAMLNALEKLVDQHTTPGIGEPMQTFRHLLRYNARHHGSLFNYAVDITPRRVQDCLNELASEARISRTEARRCRGIGYIPVLYSTNKSW